MQTEKKRIGYHKDLRFQCHSELPYFSLKMQNLSGYDQNDIKQSKSLSVHIFVCKSIPIFAYPYYLT